MCQSNIVCVYHTLRSPDTIHFGNPLAKLPKYIMIAKQTVLMKLLLYLIELIESFIVLDIGNLGYISTCPSKILK